MNIRKAIHHIRGFFVILYYKTLYGWRLKGCRGLKVRRHFDLMIGDTGVVFVGDNVFFNNYCSVSCLERVTIGEGCIFGEGVKIYDHNHKFRDPDLPIKDQGYSTAHVRIGRGCWIGTGVIILKGADIGDGCVVGAGCVVSGVLDAGTILRNDQHQCAEVREGLPRGRKTC